MTRIRSLPEHEDSTPLPGRGLGRLGSWWIPIGWGAFLLVLGGVGVSRVYGTPPDKDFSLFYEAARYWLVHGAPGGLAWYQPFSWRVLAPFGWLPSRWAGILWVAMNLACTLGSVRILGDAQDGTGRAGWWRTELLALLLMVAPWFVEFYVNQLVPPILLLILLAERARAEQRPRWTGLWLGLAILLKLSPAVFLLWLLLKRDWRSVAWTVTVVMMLGPGLDVFTVGWERALGWQREWFERVRWSGSAWTVLVTGGQCEYSNHAVVAVLRRLLHPTDSTPYFDVEVGGQHELSGSAPVNWVNLPIPVIAALWAGLMLAGVLALIVVSHRPAQSSGTERLRWEFALYSLAMLWFLPVVRQYHYVWAYPLVSLLTARVRRVWVQTGRFPWRSGPVVGLGLWVVSMLCSAPRMAQEFGVPMLGIVALGVAGWAQIRRLTPPSQAGALAEVG